VLGEGWGAETRIDRPVRLGEKSMKRLLFYLGNCVPQGHVEHTSRYRSFYMPAGFSRLSSSPLTPVGIEVVPGLIGVVVSCCEQPRNESPKPETA
jgi:hypothetical protein